MKVVFVAGAGAVEGAWGPVLESLRDCTADGTVLDPETANVFMATVVHMASFGRRFKNDQLVTPRNTVRESIRAGLKCASLQVRLEFPVVWRTFVPEDASDVTVVTTNWDNAIDEQLAHARPTLSVVHLHGAADGELYLPSETCFQPYLEKPVQQRLLRRLRHLTDKLAAADRLVIYGLSLSPLDAELCMWLAWGISLANIKQVHVVDPDHERVIRRLRAIRFENAQAMLSIEGHSPMGLLESRV